MAHPAAPPIPGGELRRDPEGPDAERAIRPREGRLLGRRGGSRRVRAGRGSNQTQRSIVDRNRVAGNSGLTKWRLVPLAGGGLTWNVRATVRYLGAGPRGT